MELNEQRKLGVKLAHEYGATKTLEAIKNTDVCYEEILKTAADEIGMEKLVSVLKDNNPHWAAQAMTVFPDLGEYRSILANAIPISGTASSLELYLVSGAAFDASFTMYWYTPGNENQQQPMTGTPDASQWQWSINLSISINRSDTMNCTDFALTNSPLKPGDTVWMVVTTAAGNRFDTGLRFTYQPNGGAVRIDTWGAVASPNFAIHTEDSVAAA